jgi:hypothetical protein
MEWGPACQCYSKNFADESPSDVAGIEIASQETDWHEVYNESQDAADDHFVVDFVYLRENVKNLTNDERTKGYCDDIR